MNILFYNKIKKTSISTLIFIMTVLNLGSNIFVAQAEEYSLDIVARNDEGDFIGNISFEIYGEVLDVDNNPKPGERISYGKTDMILGKGSIKINSSLVSKYENFIIKMWDKSSNAGAFWFYGDLTQSDFMASTTPLQVTEYLSGIKFVLRSTDGTLRKNTSFKIYTQRYDTDEFPIKETEDLVATLNTSEEGEAIIYVSNGDRTIDGKRADYYVFEANGINGGIYKKYDIKINDGELTGVNYIFSDMKINLKDNDNIPFPANTVIGIYKQSYDNNNGKILGNKLKDLKTDDKGTVVFEYPEGVYAGQITGSNNQLQQFWDLEITEGTRESYILKPDENWNSSQGNCSANSEFSIVTKDLNNKFIPNLNFELYSQIIDADNTPAPGRKLSGGSIDGNGKGSITIMPDPREKYILKIYDKSSTVGEFWFYDQLQFSCDEDKEILKYLPALNIILRDGNGDLKKNQPFSLYTQGADIDGNPLKQRGNLVSSSLNTGETGIKTIYVAPDHLYDKNKKGTYVFSSVLAGGAEFNEYNIKIYNGQNNDLEYIFSDIVLEIKDQNGKYLSDKTIELYEQTTNLRGEYALGKILKSTKTDSGGKVRIEYPAGSYAIALKDDASQTNIFWNIQINNRNRNYKTLITNLTRIKIKDENGGNMPEGTSIVIYSMLEDDAGKFYKGTKLTTSKIMETGYAEISLKPGPYLFASVGQENIEYGTSAYIENEKKQDLIISFSSLNKTENGKRYSLIRQAVQENVLAKKLSGYILLQVEKNGEAWYLNGETQKRYYMKNGVAAYNMMREFGLGITNNNLKKIPIGIDKRFNLTDSDNDAIADKMEEAIGTNPFKADTDGDGYNDGLEIINNYSPLGSEKLNLDAALSEKLKGKILLQVESKGEAWYVNPKDGKRYYMTNGDSAYEIMRYLSLGITNNDLEKISEGEF